MYGCESWTIWRLSAKELMLLNCGDGLLRVPWTAKRSNQSILNKINPEYSLEGLMLKLKLQYLGHLTHWKRPWWQERLKAGGEGDDRGWDGWIPSPTRWTWVWASSGSWWWTGKPGTLQSIGWQIIEHDWMTELIELNTLMKINQHYWCILYKDIPRP